MWFEYDASEAMVNIWYRTTINGRDEFELLDRMSITEYQTTFGLQASRALLAGR